MKTILKLTIIAIALFTSACSSIDKARELNNDIKRCESMGIKNCGGSWGTVTVTPNRNGSYTVKQR